MYIGKMNDQMSALTYKTTKKDLEKAPVLLENGNPFRSEKLHVAWQELMGSGLDMHISWGKTFRVNRLVCTLGEECAPASVAVYTEKKEKLLYCYRGETGMAISQKELTLEVEADARGLVLEIISDFSDVVIENLEIYGASFEGEMLYPTPEKYEAGEGAFLLKQGLSAWADCEEADKGLCVFFEKLKENTGLEVKKAENGAISFRRDLMIPENGYRLVVTEEKIELYASDVRGFVYGAENILKLAADGKIPACKIDDKPFQSFRGVHLFLPAETEMDFAKRMIKYMLSPMGYNHIILEIAGAMEFESHPEINRAMEEGVEKWKKGEWPTFPHNGVGGGKTVSKASTRDLVAYARKFGIEVIPEIQSLGHVQFMTLAHPEIAERREESTAESHTDERLADVPPSEFYAHCYCPSNPKSYEILFDLADEIIDVVQPKKYVHMGHDEVYQIGVCKHCKGKDPARLFADDVIKLHDYLAKKNLKMMIWGDMLQPVTKYQTPPAIDMIPKDIVMMDFIWYFHEEKDIEDNLLAKNFEVIYGNMYSSHFPRYESRIRKAGVSGAEVSSWVETEEEALAREGKLYDFLFSAQMMWSENYSRHNRYAFDRVIEGMLPAMREKIGAKCYPSRLAAAREKVLWEKAAFDPADVCQGGEIAVGDTVKSICVEHAASLRARRIPWVALDVIGRYEARYEDGETVSLPITYGGNISWWNRRHNEPFPNKYYRHNGYSATWYTDNVETVTRDGKRATLYRYEWINPYPEKKILSIAYIPDENQETGVVIQKIALIQ